ncbi:putative amino acid permease [Gordonia spumicola]|uniref:Putative amino acid permease n=1 Tax=Gordonia spumicola TaxID=589161 RepID=A0A7I9V596_9ACTN|nr:APC family permease [Gordonia spumicola]GEE00585.1 putative amino acid permease [Gordonia spumicola]
MTDTVLHTDSTTDAATGSGRLQGDLGVFHIAAMVIATASPLGVMGGAAAFAMAGGNGYGVAGTYLMMTILMLGFAYCLGVMSPSVRNAGAFFSFVGKGFGPMAGVATAALAWLVYYAVMFMVYAYLGVQVNGVVVTLGGPDVDWWVYALASMAIVGTLGYRRIDLTTKVLSVTLTVEVALILIVNTAVVVHGGASGLHFEGFTPSSMFPDGSGFAVAAMFCAMSFIGFEATTVFRDEARDPDRTVPRATYIAVVFIGLLYAGSAWAQSMGYTPDGLAEAGSQGSAVLLGNAATYVAQTLADVIQVLLVSALFATALSFHNVLARYMHTLGRAGLLPTRMSAVHPRHQAPSFSSLVMSIVSVATLAVALIAGLDPIIDIVNWANGVSALGFFVLLTVTTAAVVAFLVRRRAARPLAYVTAVGATLAFAALTWVAVVNFGTLAGGDTALAVVLIGTIPALALAALARAVVLRRTSPSRWQSLRELISSH